MSTKIFIDNFSLLLVLLILSIAVITDASKRKVPNYLTFPFMFLGLVMAYFISPQALLVRLLWLIIFFIIGSTRIMGMGDLKLLMAIIALRGITEASYSFMVSSLLLMLYCFLDTPTETIATLKDTAAYFSMRTPIFRRTDKLYPYALFIALGYPIGFLLTHWA